MFVELGDALSVVLPSGSPPCLEYKSLAIKLLGKKKQVKLQDYCDSLAAAHPDMIHLGLCHLGIRGNSLDVDNQHPIQRVGEPFLPCGEDGAIILPTPTSYHKSF